MHRTRHPRGRSSARAASLLLSVLAVLALACVPGAALAQEATGPQYDPELPQVPNEERTPQKGGGIGGDKDGGGKAGASESPDGAAGGGNGGSGSGDGTNTGQGNRASGKDGAGKAGDGGAADGKVSNGEPLATVENTAGTTATDDDGSSPLVPILIAVAILAAISIGAYYYRQRRQDPDSPVSPKAS